MVDRVYKGDIPRLRKELERLKAEYSGLDLPTNWVELRITPLLDHAKSLERRVASRKFLGEFSRLRRGVPMFHSDLVYLRTNVKELDAILKAKSASRKARSK
jgi:uncharacterized small protein (DUF1192 family)